MTAFTKSQMPNSIDTLEGVVMWSMGCLAAIHGTTQYTENDTTFGRFFIANVSTINSRQEGNLVIARGAVKLPSDYLSIPGKGWESTRLIEWPGGGEIPTSFTS